MSYDPQAGSPLHSVTLSSVHEPPRRSSATKLERAIVLQLLAGEHEHGCSHAELQAATGAAPQEIEQAVERLQQAGIVLRGPQGVSPGHAALRLDELGLIGI
jgi:hypothetical protein